MIDRDREDCEVGEPEVLDSATAKRRIRVILEEIYRDQRISSTDRFAGVLTYEELNGTMLALEKYIDAAEGRIAGLEADLER